MKDENPRKNIMNLTGELKVSFKRPRFHISGSNRSMLQFCQGEFDPSSDDAYFLFFQKTYGDYAKYQRPKLLSIRKRSSSVFKLATTATPKLLSLRYVVAQCSECREYFSEFNTTKHWKTWETNETPKISRKVLEKKGILVCTDCTWLQEGLDEAQKTPPISPVPFFVSPPQDLLR